MVLPHIGYKEENLISINTDKFDFYILGKPIHPNVGKLIDIDNKVSALKIKCNEKFDIEHFSFNSVDKKEHKRCSSSFSIEIQPLFYEQQNYQIIIENKGEFDIIFWHENGLLREKVKPIKKSKGIHFGTINFGSSIGLTTIKILVDGIKFLQLTIEIFPSKIDYYKDYISILNDISNEIYNLAFDFLKKTYLWSNLKDDVWNSPTEFFSIITYVFKKFKLAIDIIIESPHHTLSYESNIVPYHKLRKSQSSTIKWLRKNPNQMIKIDNNYYPMKALYVTKKVTYNTLENRFTKYILNSTISKLKKVKSDYSKLERRKDNCIINKIDSMISDLEWRMNHSFLKEVEENCINQDVSLVFNMALGYRDLFKYYLMLQRGLTLNGEVFKLSIKDLSMLYEYWCFIKLNSILKNKYQLIKQDIIKADGSGLFVTLKKGKKATVKYRNIQNGEIFSLSYNQSMRSLPTVSQKPDNILSLKKERSKVKYNYIFDAKYRINPALEDSVYKRAYKYPGPQEDDINTMHRYRDAIVYASSNKQELERVIFGAYILFPYNEEAKYMSHTFYKSIGKVNVGGLPFLPSSTVLVEQLLEELISDSPESAFERSILPKGTYEYIEKMDFDCRNVLVGAVRNKQQFSMNIKHNFYHIPYSRVKNKNINSEYIALYQSEKTFKEDAGINFYGKVKDWKLVKRKEILELPKDSDELYIKFNIDNWVMLNKRIKTKEYGVYSNVYTTFDLLLEAKCLPELCIKTKDEYRLYRELIRACYQIDIKISKKTIDDSNIQAFKHNNALILIDGNLIRIKLGSKYREFHLSEFRFKPTAILNRIKNFIKDCTN